MQKSIAKRGFTLVELLVVIAIIGILASFLMPALSRARYNAREIVELNNMRQVALGFIFYTGDYNGMFPYHWSRNDHEKFFNTRDYEGGPYDYRVWAEEYGFLSATSNPLTGAEPWNHSGNTNNVLLQTTWTFWYSYRFSNRAVYSAPKMSKAKPGHTMLTDLLRRDPASKWYGIVHNPDVAHEVIQLSNNTSRAWFHNIEHGDLLKIFSIRMDGSFYPAIMPELKNFTVAGYQHYYIPNN